MSVAKDELHHLVDALPEHEVVAAKRFLEFLLEAEERLENIELEKEFGYRANTSREQFVEKPTSMPFKDFYEEYRRSRQSE